MTQLRQSIDVSAPLKAVYNQWTQFEDFPRFMEGVREVQQTDPVHLHWRATRHGRELEWDSEITEQVPDQFIAWRDVGGPGNAGRISFVSLKEDATRVELTMDMHAASGSEPAHDEQAVSRRLEQDLIRFKQMLETAGHESGAWRGEMHNAHPADAPSSQEPPAQSEDKSAQKGSQQQAWLPNLLQGWEEPLVMMRKMSDEMDQLFERFLGRPMAFRFGQGGVAGKWTPALEITQRGQQLVVCAELPGVSKDDIKIEIRQGKLVLEGERKAPEKHVTPAGFRRSERSYGNFYRAVPLPEGIDPEQTRATMHEGVLEIVLALPPQGVQHGRRIDINTDQH